jgi:hypothetical protein
MGRCRRRKIPRLFILESNVVRLSPSLAAAPWGPPISPPAARNVCKIRATSCSRNVPCGATRVIDVVCDGGRGLGSTPIVRSDDGAFNQVLEFPYITGPMVCNECIHRVHRVMFGLEKAFSTPQCLTEIWKSVKMNDFFSRPYTWLNASSCLRDSGVGPGRNDT